jgi:predicted RNase H-like HicB family nuclease
MEARYTVALKKTDEGFSVWCPGLPGCWSQGETEQEALENIGEAIKDYLAVAAELAGDEERREIALTI